MLNRSNAETGASRWRFATSRNFQPAYAYLKARAAKADNLLDNLNQLFRELDNFGQLFRDLKDMGVSLKQ